ncbi:hypothetical protein GXP67_01860 [Rhodocytophaga rosea]|uniref:RNA polymerase sigma-70 region 2 domain-containing protein n=1 Tax=Rhodocytophaga rosea TaxID=2704465 RepID=A0A6C0GCE5_9BACT|nr:sigma factor [Rhodocytophaga rosea]QHT65502.1 hypothetical protein GXP67_01860 [Rhodocytophaga rosea]
MKSNQEIELIDKVLKGDKKAFNILVDKYYKYCLDKASRIMGDREVAKDLVQNGIIQAYVSLGNLKDKTSFKFWLGGIVTNICKNYIRDNKKSICHYDSTMMTSATGRMSKKKK